MLYTKLRLTGKDSAIWTPQIAIHIWWKNAQRRRKHCRKTDPLTNKQKQGAITIHCAAASLARSVNIICTKLVTQVREKTKN